MFGVQLYKNNTRALLSRILSILNLDWLQHARSVRGVYEYHLSVYLTLVLKFIIFSTNVISQALPEVTLDESSYVVDEGGNVAVNIINGGDTGVNVG